MWCWGGETSFKTVSLSRDTHTNENSTLVKGDFATVGRIPYGHRHSCVRARLSSFCITATAIHCAFPLPLWLLLLSTHTHTITAHAGERVRCAPRTGKRGRSLTKARTNACATTSDTHTQVAHVVEREQTKKNELHASHASSLVPQKYTKRVA